jgi:membrane dipeptidase
MINNEDKPFSSIKLIDGHSHIGFIRENSKINSTEITELLKRNFNGAIIILPLDRSDTENLEERILREIDFIKEIATKEEKICIFQDKIENNYDFQRNIFSVLFSLEYFAGTFRNNLKSLQRYKDAGIRYITLINNKFDQLISIKDNLYQLTHFGIQLIKTMNENQIMIDISHLNEDEKLLILESTSKPVIVSHTNIRGVAQHSFNLSDKVLKALKRNNALILISFNKRELYGNLSNDRNAIEILIDHIDYVTKFVGLDNVGIGSDLQAKGKYVPETLYQYNMKEMLIKGLRERGYSQLKIGKILSGNLLAYMN